MYFLKEVVYCGLSHRNLSVNLDSALSLLGAIGQVSEPL